MAASDVHRSIPQFFAGRSVFITGATGFMGKVLVEKLLRSCPQVGTVYLLMRPKRGHEINRRLEDLTHFQLFERLRSEQPGFESHLHPVRGDVTLKGLGLSAADRDTLTKEVSVVFHCAANVRFDQKLRDAVQFNTLGTKRVLQLASDMVQLKAFVHVSTAYCHCDEEVVQEVTYPARTDPERVLQMLEWMDDDLLDSLAPKLLGNMPNTYAYSKNLTEQLVANFADKIPICLARPSIVTAVWRDPLPGWVDNINGPTGLLVGAGKGVIRSMHCKGEFHADVVPVDIVINGLLGLAWHVANTRPKTPLVCNLTTSNDNPITWAEVLESGRRHLHNNPLSDAVWYPDGSIKNSRLLHNLSVVFFHFMPAYIIDFLVTLCGKKPFMVKIQRRIQGGLEVLQYYTTKEWQFQNHNFHVVANALTPEDKETFYMDISKVNWDAYTLDSVLGTRHYYLKEDPSSLPRARRHIQRLYYLDRIVSVICYLFLFWLVFCWSDQLLGLLDAFLSHATDALSLVLPAVRARAESAPDESVAAT